jgi:aspartyl/asparaginyl beta-hydroxylase (cupin superfamily)
MLITFILVIIIILVFLPRARSPPRSLKNPKIIYETNEFPPIQRLNDSLLDNYSKVCAEVVALQKVPISDIVIKKGAIYSATDSEVLLQQIRKSDAWTMGWDNKTSFQHDKWKQYPIIYKGEMFDFAKKRLPLICALLEPVKDKFHTVFISTIKPYGEIEKHCDGGDRNNVTEKDRLTYHFNIDCPPTSILTIEDINVIQYDKESIIFDSAFEHGVKNQSAYPRTIFCAKFFISKCKK